MFNCVSMVMGWTCLKILCAAASCWAINGASADEEKKSREIQILFISYCLGEEGDIFVWGRLSLFKPSVFAAITRYASEWYNRMVASRHTFLG